VHVRDAIVHAAARSPERRRKLGVAVADFDRRRLTVTSYGAQANLFLRAQSPRLAKWAYSTARKVILAILDVAPDVEAVKSLNSGFRNRLQLPDIRVPMKLGARSSCRLAPWRAECELTSPSSDLTETGFAPK